jgi:SAM-dependent methyltransferase
MAGHVCPWWAVAITIDVPFRRWLHDPQKIVGPYLRPGMTAVDVGCGVGWFSIPMARMVGQQGKVIAVDLQPQMLDMLRRRAEKAGVLPRLELHQCRQDRLGIDAAADFALVFAMLHEVPDQRRLLGEIHDLLKPGGRLLLAEPPIHISGKAFANEVAAAEAAGFQVQERLRLRWCRAAVLVNAEPATLRPPVGAGLCLLPGDLAWQANAVVHGLETAVLVGDPNAAGDYVQRIKMPAGTRLAPHWHADRVRRVTVLGGTLYFAFGAKFDEGKLKALPAGSFFVEPPGVPHFAMTKEDVMLQLDAVGPTGTTYASH